MWQQGGRERGQRCVCVGRAEQGRGADFGRPRGRRARRRHPSGREHHCQLRAGPDRQDLG